MTPTQKQTPTPRSEWLARLAKWRAERLIERARREARSSA